MTDVVSIKTGKPVISARKEASDRREALIRDGKRWQKFIERIKSGELNITIAAVGQELDFNDMIIPYLDSLIVEQDEAERKDKRHQKYLKSKE